MTCKMIIKQEFSKRRGIKKVEYLGKNGDSQHLTQAEFIKTQLRSTRLELIENAQRAIRDILIYEVIYFRGFLMEHKIKIRVKSVPLEWQVL